MFKANIDNHRRLDIEGETFLIDPRIAEVIEQVEQERDALQGQCDIVMHHLGHVIEPGKLKPAGMAALAEKEILELRAQRDAAVRLLRAALDENPTWSSDAAFEAERLVEEVDNDD